jgi:hypothetical protein
MLGQQPLLTLPTVVAAVRQVALLLKQVACCSAGIAACAIIALQYDQPQACLPNSKLA